MTVTRNKDGVPTWTGDPITWQEYERTALPHVETTSERIATFADLA